MAEASSDPDCSRISPMSNVLDKLKQAERELREIISKSVEPSGGSVITAHAMLLEVVSMLAHATR